MTHSVRPASVDDGDLTPGHASDPGAWVASLAFLKATSCAQAIRGEVEDGAVVLGADTVCVHGGEIIGKPVDEADARRIIETMRGGVHEVLTGVALVLVGGRARDVFVDRSVVTVGDIADGEIEVYLGSGLWRGKAGAYNISERLEAGWDLKFEGCDESIAGLPVARVVERLALIGGL